MVTCGLFLSMVLDKPTPLTQNLCLFVVLTGIAIGLKSREIAWWFATE